MIALEAGMEPVPGYQLRQLLKSGETAEVWEAETAAGQVALKFISCDKVTAAHEMRSLQLRQELRHPNLLTIDSFGYHQGRLIIAMELADGSLADLLESYQSELGTPISMEKVCLLLGQAAEVLDFLNSHQQRLTGRGVAFRYICDVSPGSLLLFGDTVKLSDLELAIGSSPLKVRPRERAPEYIAPELSAGRLNSRSTQFSLAVTYCQLRGGRLPFVEAVDRAEPSYLEPESDQVSEGHEFDLTMLSESERPIVARALSFEPQRRWPTCVDLITQLQIVLVTGRAVVEKSTRAAKVVEQARLVPVGGGDAIPLVKQKLTIGRRKTADICLAHANISGFHCELHFTDGVWHITDLDSSNGIKVNGKAVQRSLLRPGDRIAIATHQFTILYR